MEDQFKNIFKDKTVLVTGHTGFKGSWLSIWLHEMGANVIGYSLPPSTYPSNFELANLGKKITHIQGDIRDIAFLKKIIKTYSPEIVFHLAAQAIVLDSYIHPQETFEINLMGTVNILEAVRNTTIQAMVLVTTDKCYENKDWLWGYRENDRLGGNDPYSASKAMSELAICSYQESFYKNVGPFVASARAGNVIGGGDFSTYRLLPDIIRALMQNQPVNIRNSLNTRPWLHVLEPLCGYLQLAAKLIEKKHHFAHPWNFGPLESQGISVQNVVEKTIELWGEGTWIEEKDSELKKEMANLRLNWDKASHLLQWKPLYCWDKAVEKTVEWYKVYQSSLKNEHPNLIYELCVGQIADYTQALNQKGNYVAKY